MRPRIWWQPTEYPDSLVGDYDESEGPERLAFRAGRLIEHPQQPLLRFSASRKRLRKWDVLHNISGLPICNQRTISIVRSFAGDTVQDVPAQVRARDGGLEGYAVLNLLKHVPAIDMKQSDVVLMENAPRILKIHRLVLTEIPQDVHLARAAEYRSLVLVSVALSDALLDAKISGFGFLEDSEFTM